ncbi:T4 bacteriophage base plate protein [Balnearium lithotrophicum]|uniref:T4 bacteriophage base plate protein n=1 Tax=Balnearium lithotrophicum TaxID=223788 RepID=A0A521CIU4_9BACT|nr:hypothetical protein [Balnearium lithotrophicum]SMO59348.1 T4 bacteriophage base plate protein [Balnearium lithotrophicum]
MAFVEPEAIEVKLPSKGLLGYSGKVLIRPITGREEKIIASANGDTVESAINRVLNRCIKEGPKAEELSEGDKSFLLVWLRVNSYFPDYSVEIDCPACKKVFKKFIDLKKLPIKEIQVDKLPLEIEINGRKVALSPLTSQEVEEVNNYKSQLAAQGRSLEDLYSVSYAYMIRALDGKEVPLSERIDFIEGLLGRELAKLRKAERLLEHGVDFRQDLKCPLCGKSFTANIPITLEFFLPTEFREE